MEYGKFSQEVYAAAAAKKAVDAYAAKQADGMRVCPRCGQPALREELRSNPLSNYAAVYICDACSADEADRDSRGEPLLLRDWAIAKSDT